MSVKVRTWWGERFLVVLHSCMDTGRLKRGRAYSGPRRMLDFKIAGTNVKARLRGNVNANFGVYKEPRYNATVSLRQISAANWKHITNDLSWNAAFMSQLLLNEMPTDIERIFLARNLRLLPARP